MYLKSLEINGFKSFGKKVALEFTSPITSVVGPNGSGKSNVAESFRFVLGEQSMRSMRGKRGEDLIFNGSDAGQQSLSRLNRASVKLVFDNSKKILPIDFDEVSLERVVHRDGVNEYFLNGSQVRLKDIQELLSHAHIGSSGHHIISQGEADRILSANTKERKSMLEDALGLNVFQNKKLESQRKLEKTTENIKQVESLRRELAPHLKFLGKQMEKVEKAETLRADLRQIYKEYLKREELYLMNSKSSIEAELSNPESELAELAGRIEMIRKSLTVSEGENAPKLELIEAERKFREKQNEKQKLSHSIGRLEGELSSLHRMIERSQRQVEEESHHIVPLVEIEKIVREINQDFEKAEKENSIELFKSAFGKMRDVFNNFISNHKVKPVVSSGENYQEEMDKLQKEKERTLLDLERVGSEEQELQSKIRSLNHEIEVKSKDNLDAEREMFQIMSRQNELQSQTNLLRSKKNQLALEHDEWKREVNEAYVLIGREIMEYESLQIEYSNEDRSIQHDRRRQIEKVKIRIEELGIGGIEELTKEYREAQERDGFLAREVVDLVASGDDLQILIKDLEEKINTEFKSGIEKINTEFQKYFELLFGGGKASLKVVREEASDAEAMEAEGGLPAEASAKAGIDISVDLPKKKVKALMMLSGGERALTSIALLFAMSQVNPPPFIILDETDAALDEANSKKYGDMIEALAKYSQLIVITHNRETMSRAGIIYGVTMMSGLSKLLSIKFDEAVAVAK